VIPVALAFLAAIFAYEALVDRSAMTSVVVAKVPIAAGQLVNSTDVQTVRVHKSDAPFAKGIVVPSQLVRPEVAVVGLSPGQLLTYAELAPERAAVPFKEMSVPVPIDQAVGGQLAAGDRVDIIQSGPGAKARYIAQGLTVVSVAASSSSGGILNGASGNYYVTLAVSKRTALTLAAALAQSGVSQGIEIEVVRSDERIAPGPIAPPSAVHQRRTTHISNT
jgi:Flp pilus assembly protein CpaB